MSTAISEHARFNARLSKEQKLLLEKAANIGGFRSLTDFVISTAQDKANEIIQENEKILASKRDGEIFFDALKNAKEPSSTLVNALNDYNKFLSNLNND